MAQLSTLGSIERMSKKFTLTIAVLFVLVLGWLTWDYCQFAKQDEASRMSAASRLLGEKLASYFSAHGRYPDSLDMLSVANHGPPQRNFRRVISEENERRKRNLV